MDRRAARVELVILERANAPQWAPSSAACETSRRCERRGPPAHFSSARLTLLLQGLHFVHHTCGGHDCGSGEFLDVAGGEVFVRKWDDALETFAHEGGGLSGAERTPSASAGWLLWLTRAPRS